MFVCVCGGGGGGGGTETHREHDHQYLLVLHLVKGTNCHCRITLGGLGPNCLFHFINADFIGSADYDDNYY